MQIYFLGSLGIALVEPRNPNTFTENPKDPFSAKTRSDRARKEMKIP
jgi:hypothetical protein